MLKIANFLDHIYLTSFTIWNFRLRQKTQFFLFQSYKSSNWNKSIFNNIIPGLIIRFYRICSNNLIGIYTFFPENFIMIMLILFLSIYYQHLSSGWMLQLRLASLNYSVTTPKLNAFFFMAGQAMTPIAACGLEKICIWISLGLLD